MSRKKRILIIVIFAIIFSAIFYYEIWGKKNPSLTTAPPTPTSSINASNVPTALIYTSSTPTPSIYTSGMPISIANNTSTKPDGAVKKAVAPWFTLQTVNGQKVSLKNLLGKKVYLYFWSSWNTYARNQILDIEKINNEYKNKDYVILGINSGETIDIIRDYVKKNKFSFKILQDTDVSVSSIYSVTVLPTSVFINSKGEIENVKEGQLSIDEIKYQLNKISK